MAKRSFASQLARGFVRAAVNQVGRDGGRVISNQIYNGQNFVPVTNVAPGAQPFMDQNTNQMVGTPDGQQISTTKSFSVGKIVLLTMISLIVMFFGGLGVFLYGLVTYLKKTDKIVWYENVPQYATDRRYKTGERFLGYMTVKREAVVAGSPEVIDTHKRNGIIAMVIGAIGIVIYIVMLIANNI